MAKRAIMFITGIIVQMLTLTSGFIKYVQDEINDGNRVSVPMPFIRAEISNTVNPSTKCTSTLSPVRHAPEIPDEVITHLERKLELGKRGLETHAENHVENHKGNCNQNRRKGNRNQNRRKANCNQNRRKANCNQNHRKGRKERKKNKKHRRVRHFLNSLCKEQSWFLLYLVDTKMKEQLKDGFFTDENRMKLISVPLTVGLCKQKGKKRLLDWIKSLYDSDNDTFLHEDERLEVQNDKDANKDKCEMYKNFIQNEKYLWKQQVHHNGICDSETIVDKSEKRRRRRHSKSRMQRKKKSSH